MKKLIIMLGIPLFLTGCDQYTKVEEVSVPNLTENSVVSEYKKQTDSSGNVFSDPARVQLATPEENQKTAASFQVIE